MTNFWWPQSEFGNAHSRTSLNLWNDSAMLQNTETHRKQQAAYSSDSFTVLYILYFDIRWTRIFLLRQREKDQKPFVCCAELFVSIQSCNEIDWTKKCISYMNSNILTLKLSFLASHLYIRSEACCANLFCWDHCIEGYNCSSERVKRSRPPSTPTPPSCISSSAFLILNRVFVILLTAFL